MQYSKRRSHYDNYFRWHCRDKRGNMLSLLCYFMSCYLLRGIRKWILALGSFEEVATHLLLMTSMSVNSQRDVVRDIALFDEQQDGSSVLGIVKDVVELIGSGHFAVVHRDNETSLFNAG